MEGVGIFHNEFATPHQTKSGTNLIAEFALYLIQIDGQLPVGAQQIGGQICDHFLMGRPQSQLAPLTIFQMEHDALPCGVAGPTAAALPQLRRLKLGQQGFKGSGAVHLLTHHPGNLLEHPPHQGEIGVDARGNPADVAGAKQQLVRGNLSLRRIVAERHQHQAGDAHSRSFR